jgi:hypothetical protein
VGGLACAPAYQQVALNSTMTFTASGGDGRYNWGTSNQGSYMGPTFAWTASQPGLQQVVVASAGQTAICTVQVIGSYVSASGAPYYSKYPKLPNTGYAPFPLTQLALAAALLMLAGWLSYPYVRNAFAYLRG